MKHESEDECEVEDVPVSALLSEDRRNRYGSVPGLDDEELASPEELERHAFIQDWWPILQLPRQEKSPITPNIDEYFGLDFGAFATVDFERDMPEFDKARYKADRLQEELRDALIMLSVIRYRLTNAQLTVLKYLGKGRLDFDDVRDADTLAVARTYLKALRLQREIRRLRDASWSRRRKELAEVLK